MEKKIASQITQFFKDFHNEDVEILEINEGSTLSTLCNLSDGEYKVILNSDYTVRAYYRKKSFKCALKSGSETLKENNTWNGLPPSKKTNSNVKRPLLSNTEQTITLLIKKSPGITSYEIKKEINMRFTMLIPILQKLLNLGVIKKEGEQYY